MIITSKLDVIYGEEFFLQYFILIIFEFLI